MSTRYYTASSLDGFIADPEATLAWLTSREIDSDGPMGYAEFIAGVGAVVMGSTTYEWVVEHEDGRWPYDIPTWVLTHRELPTVEGDVRFSAAPVAQVHAEMTEAAAGRDLWVVGGGDVAGQFADAGLLDEVWVSYAPVALGSGAPLLPRHLELHLLDVARNGDFACARWEVVR
jgi:dihydrofolate reductase